MVEESKEKEIIDDQTVEFFSRLIDAMCATITTKSESGKMIIPTETTRPYDAMFSVLTQADRKNTDKAILTESDPEKKKEFMDIRTEFVERTKKAIKEKKKEEQKR